MEVGCCTMTGNHTEVEPRAMGDGEAAGDHTDAPPHGGALDSFEAVEGLSFERALAELEGVVDRLEGGDLELETALASFERGVKLTRRCSEQLDAAGRRVELLVQQGDQWLERDFLAEGEPAFEDSEDEIGEDAEVDEAVHEEDLE
jgi:exodeoxyribonuclease VII small subunit